MGDAASFILEGVDGQPLRIDMPTFGAIPDFALPTAVSDNSVPHGLIEVRTVTARTQHGGCFTLPIFWKIPGDATEGSVNPNDVIVLIRDQNPLATLIEHTRRQPEFGIFMLQRAHQRGERSGKYRQFSAPVG